MSTGARSRFEISTAAGLYTALAVLWCHQLLVGGIGRVLPNDLGDPLLSTWILWWNSRTVPLTDAWWNAPAFYPATGALSFSETLLSIAALTDPLMWVGASPVTAYNIAFIVSFAASALTGYLLCREATGSHAAALVGGAYFGFGPHRAAHLPHIQMLWTLWIPVLFLSLFRYRATGRQSYLLLIALSWIGIALTSVYFLLYVSVGAALWGVWFLTNRSGTAALAHLVAVGAVATAVPLPMLAGFAAWHQWYGLKRNIGEMESFSADVTSLADGGHLLWTWPNLQSLDRPEGSLYPGLFAALLLAAGTWRWWRQREAPRGSAKLSAILGAISLLLFAIGLATLWTRGAQWGLGPIQVSITTPYKPMGLGAVLLLVAVLLLPAVRASWRARSSTGWWVLLAVAAYVFALGPTGRFLGYRFWYKAPYSWLMTLPGFDSVRVPARFGTLFALALAVLVAIAVRRLTSSGTTRRWLPMAALVLVLADGLVTIQAVPMLEPVPANAWNVDAVLEIPLETYRDAAAMGGSFRHGLPVVNGYSGFGPPHYAILMSAIREGRMSALDELRRFGGLAVVVDETADEGRIWLPLLGAYGRPDLTAPNSRRVFVLPRVTEPHTCLARALAAGISPTAISGISTHDKTVDPAQVALTVDGDLTTFHTVSESTTVGDGFELTLDREQAIAGVVLWMGPVPNDHPGLIRVAVRNGAGARTAFDGDVAGFALVGAIADPRRVPLAICFPPTEAREVVISAPVITKRPWNVAEISVIAR